MKVVQGLKEAFKAAIRSGKIFYVGAIEKTYTKVKIPTVDLLNFEQWKLLEKNEDVLEVTLQVRNTIMMILFAKEN